MNRYSTATAMAVSLAALGALTGQAKAACSETTPLILTCSDTVTSPIDDGRDTLSVVFQSSASFVAATGRPVTLSGADQSLDNDGLIESLDADEDAVQGEGPNLTVNNSGIIKGGDRGVRLQDDADNVTITNSGEISARRQAVRFDNGDELANASITNTTTGLIESDEGRAIQSRGPGTTIVNDGTIRGNEEVIEAREDFSLINTGTIALIGLDWDPGTQTWTNNGATTDEDGVQFASGTLTNSGVILGTDDGVDLDQGTVVNSGAIVSTGADGDPSDGGSGIDVDALFEPTVGPTVAAGPLSITNEGYIEGVRAIGTDPGSSTEPSSASELTIMNSGTLVGRSGVAIQMAPTQGDSSLTLSGDSAIFGDVLFGGGNDTLTIGNVSAGPLINSVFDGGAGTNTVSFADLALDAVTRARFATDVTELTLDTPEGAIFGAFRHFGFWQFGTEPALTTAEFRGALPQSAVVPLPAALPLLLGALGGLAWIRRRSPRG